MGLAPSVGCGQYHIADDFEGSAHQAYGSMPIAIFIIGVIGKDSL